MGCPTPADGKVRINMFLAGRGLRLVCGHLTRQPDSCPLQNTSFTRSFCHAETLEVLAQLQGKHEDD